MEVNGGKYTYIFPIAAAQKGGLWFCGGAERRSEKGGTGGKCTREKDSCVINHISDIMYSFSPME